MSEEEKKAIKYLKNEIERVNKENNFKKMPKEIVCIPLFLTYSETLLNLIEKLQSKINKRDNEIIEFNTSGIKCKNKDIHCPTSKETLDYYENFLIPGYEEEIKKLQKENEELKNKVIKRDNEIIELEESAEKEFLTKQEVKENYIPKDKIEEKLEELENEEKALRKDFEKHRVQLFELYKKVVLIEGYKKLLEEE